MKKIITTLAVCISMLAGASSAATPTGVSGVIIEGPNVTYPGGTPNCTINGTSQNTVSGCTIGDTSNTAATPDTTMEFSDDAWIFGRVYSGFTDAFTIDMTGFTFRRVVSLMGQTAHSVLNLDVTGFGTTYKASDDTSSYGNLDTFFDEIGLTGVVDVSLFMTGPQDGSKSSMWLVDVMDVQAVPLPASSLLLLAGLGGLGAMRRRKTA